MFRNKKVLSMIVCVAFVGMLFGGCAGNRMLDPNYLAYVQTVQNQQNLQAQQPPLVDLKVDDEGKIEGLKVFVPPEKITPQQYRRPAAHPAWKLAGKALGVVGTLGGIYLAGQALEGILEAGTGNTTNNSWGDGSGNHVGGDMSTVDVTNTNTVSGHDNVLNSENTFDYESTNTDIDIEYNDNDTDNSTNWNASDSWNTDTDNSTNN